MPPGLPAPERKPTKRRAHTWARRFASDGLGLAACGASGTGRAREKFDEEVHLENDHEAVVDDMSDPLSVANR